ncbi:peptide chain release factor N(5)-glutamine methyltransferase [Christiangramia aquimixticola]|uniref:peptide chain release factor N(5)-glutamine methyltransferase n=1 Tax=Christiangramia aquimixticola TaxID=1697558 RepID=UPI003AA955D5
MTISQLRENFKKSLVGLYPETEVDSFFYLLAEEFLDKRRLDIALDPSAEADPEGLQSILDALERLKKYEPVQYILGYTEFYGLKFQVDKNVLIPRPETEQLISWVLSDIPKEQNLSILDIGTGSGCIPVNLAKHLSSAKITAYDISEGALKVATENARFHKVEIDFKKADILKMQKLPQQFDVIISNPPYVRELEKKEMHKNVLKHEPDTALYVEDENALIFYKKITELAAENLATGGLLYFEINQYLGAETKELVEEMNFVAELKKDIFGNYRMLKAVKK